MTKNNVLIFAGSSAYLDDAKGIYKIAATLGQAQPVEAAKSATILTKAPSELKETAKIAQVAHLVVASGGRWHIANGKTRWKFTPFAKELSAKAKGDGYEAAGRQLLEGILSNPAGAGAGLDSNEASVREGTVLAMFAQSDTPHRVEAAKAVAAVI